jgi:Alw26I/Eco31I/Esp3I family type II restriction endonuclease
MRQERRTHPDFIIYQRLIANHPVYETLPNKFNPKGEIRWVSASDPLRAAWWDANVSRLALTDRASVARSIHPADFLGRKPCQICGRQMSIHFDYFNKRALKILNKRFGDFDDMPFQRTAREALDSIVQVHGKESLKNICADFKVSFCDSTELLILELRKSTSLLSPGVLPNAPDRLDGFHSFNACCRAAEDKGRSAENMATYAIDRRAFENWADGDWRCADKLMNQFKISKTKIACPSCGEYRQMTADHVGPISLGFRHRMDFKPMCLRCNSRKNNRLTYSDVQLLLEAERRGEDVISWHSKTLWDRKKTHVKSDEDALKLVKQMRQNMHYVLLLLSEIYQQGFWDFLEEYLHPEYALWDYEFYSFDVSTGAFTGRRYPVNSANTRKLQQRYLRISLEALEEYVGKGNRKVVEGDDTRHISALKRILSAELRSRNFDKARYVVQEILEAFASGLP